MSSVQQNVIKHKVGLLNLAAELGNVSRACKVMGFSRDTFYRYQSAVESGGVDALIDANRRKPNPKNRVEEATELAVAAFAIEQPAFGQVRVSNELRKRGIFISPSGVRSVWLRHDLESFIQATWQSMTSSTPAPRPITRRSTASVSASTRRFCKSSTKWRSGARYTGQSRNCRSIWTTGCTATIMIALIRERCVADEHPCKH
jgi:hypothetical protein